MDERRLESWKEIAAHLNRDVRTAQRWEREEELPVHRHQHQKQATVYAYAAELDAWLAQRRPRLRNESNPRLWILGVAIVALLLSVYGASRLGDDPPAKLMLAVLPLDNLSGDPGQDYISDGLTDELTTRLGGLSPERLGVIAWGSVKTYKQDPRAIERIGRELGVQYVVEGSVRSDNGRVRVNVQLVRVSDQTHLWAESYEQPLGDVLNVQRDVARAVAREIELTLTPQEDAKLADVATMDPEAYENYLRGLVAFTSGTGIGDLEASNYFRAAVAKEPQFALGHAWLGLSLNLLAFSGFVPIEQASTEARVSAQRALELDPNLAEAHVSLSATAFLFDWDWETARREIGKAIELNANSPWAHWADGWQLTALRRHDAAIDAMKRARSLDPLNPYINDCVGEMYWFADRYDEAEKEWRLVGERHPEYPRTFLLFRLMYETVGRYDEAIAAYERLNAMLARDREIAASLREAYAQAGARGYWSWWLEHTRSVKEVLSVSDASPVSYVRLYGELGEMDTAFLYLEQAFEGRNGNLPFLRVGHVFDRVRGHPRYEAIVRAMDFPAPE